MDDADRTAGSGRRAILWLALSAFGLLFTLGLVTGIFAGHTERGGGPLSSTLIAFLAGAAVVFLVSLYGCYRSIRTMTANVRTLPARDRRNSITLMVSGLLGGVIAFVMIFADAPMGVFSSSPIPAIYAIVLILLIGVVVPLLSLYWHLRVVDEQEAAAYHKGVLIAIYAYWIGAPVWWIGWRGGLLPAPDGMAIYLATIVIAGAVWLWAKYR